MVYGPWPGNISCFAFLFVVPEIVYTYDVCIRLYNQSGGV